RSRVVVMPKGKWREFEHSEDADLPALFIRPGAIVPMGPTVQHTGELKPGEYPVTLIISLDETGHAKGELYEDAGEGLGYLKGESGTITFEATRGPDGKVAVKKTEPDRPFSSATRKFV